MDIKTKLIRNFSCNANLYRLECFHRISISGLIGAATFELAVYFKIGFTLPCHLGRLIYLNNIFMSDIMIRYTLCSRTRSKRKALFNIHPVCTQTSSSSKFYFQQNTTMTQEQRHLWISVVGTLKHCCTLQVVTSEAVRLIKLDK